MLYLVVGMVAFTCFFLYDAAASRSGRLWAGIGRFGFLAGCLLLLCSTAGCLVDAAAKTPSGTVRITVFAVLAGLFLLLLVYTLFFALPFKSTYAEEAPSPGGAPLCRRGVYALCRHPGVLWLSGLYLCLWLALQGALLLAAWIVFTALDAAYVIYQDRVSFPALFPEYGDYRRETPFLIPTRRSLRRCMETWGRKGGTAGHDV